MLKLIYVFGLLCFKSNTTVMLDMQTRELIFKAWPRNDESREFLMCKQLNGDSYKLSIQVGAYKYVYPQLVLYAVNKNIQISIPCTEMPPNNCQLAFKAKSAIFTMEYQLGKQNVTEVVSNLRRLDFNRSACGVNTTIVSGKNVNLGPSFGNLITNVFIFNAHTQACRYPIDQPSVIAANNPADKKAIMHFVGWPVYFLVTPFYSLTPEIFMQNQFYPCELLKYFTTEPGVVEACNDMSNFFTTSSFAYYSIKYSVPGLVPNRDGKLTRLVNYTSMYESNKKQDTLDSMFDCYSNQSIIIFEQQMLLSNTINESMQFCKLPIHDYIQYPFDRQVTRIIFQQNEDFRVGNTYTIDFVSQTQVLNSSFQWLSCEDAINISLCQQMLSMKGDLNNFVLRAQQLFYKNGKVVQLVQLNPSLQLSCTPKATTEVQNDQICTQIENSCDNSLLKQANYQFLYSFLTVNGEQNLSTLGMYPSSGDKYCAYHNFSQMQIQSIMKGYLRINKEFIPINQVTDKTKAENVQNIIYIVVGVAVFMVIFVSGSLLKQWV
ncbi:Conserved_hypothetical protein [Hexamita inflata]|uniref:Uncharacterized protein n=1 Tax=Hexamita inflata TaxID=28002 RepID=A0AA86NPD5_9EUKA|nr:Conserved hypothetical protein [Hexamita inflata]